MTELTREASVGVAAPRSGGFVSSAVELLLHPGDFFERILRTRGDRLPFLVIWICGSAGALDKIDQRMIFGRLPAEAPVLTSWPSLWAAVLIGGTVQGLLVWLVAGWWYRMRLRFSGARDVNKRHARNVLFFASLTWAIPVLAILTLSTLLYPDYFAASTAGPLAFTTSLTFPWAVWVSYRSVRRCFAVNATWARVWFLIVPLCLYGTIFTAALVAGFAMG